MATHGAAASYYGDGQTQVQGPPEAYQQDRSKYEQQTPSYGHNLQNNEVLTHGDGKTTFSQAFKIDKPRYNDLWAGILVCRPRFLGLWRKVLSDIPVTTSSSWHFWALSQSLASHFRAIRQIRDSVAEVSTMLQTTSRSTPIQLSCLHSCSS